MTDTLDPSRRRALAQLSVGSLTTLAPWALSTSFAQAKPLTVGVIYVGPRDDFGYNQAQAQAAAEVKKLPAFLGMPSLHRPPQCEKRTSGCLGASASTCGSK